MTWIVEARNVHRSHALPGHLLRPRSLVHAVNGVTLQIARGAVLGLIGESGCGKSTLARLLLGLDTPSAGEILIDGRPVGSMSRLERARKIQIVFQDPNGSLNPRKSIRSILTLPLKIHGIADRREQGTRAREMLELVSLPARMLDSLPGELSGGQRQRVAIARALIMRPEIVVCDEPTSALDVSVQAQILNLLDDLRREFNLTYLVISHNLAVVEHMADRIAVMYRGRIVEENEANAIMRQPAHPYTQVLLRSVLTPDPSLGLPDIGEDYMIGELDAATTPRNAQ